MAEIIHLRDIDAARRRSRRRAADHQALELAVDALKDSLADVAGHLREAPPGEQAELLDRVERLAALIRYGLRMLGEPPTQSDGPATLQPR